MRKITDKKRVNFIFIILSSIFLIPSWRRTFCATVLPVYDRKWPYYLESILFEIINSKFVDKEHIQLY